MDPENAQTPVVPSPSGQQNPEPRGTASESTMTDSTLSGLRSAGIDVFNSSRVSEANEFSGAGSEYESMPPTEIIDDNELDAPESSAVRIVETPNSLPSAVPKAMSSSIAPGSIDNPASNNAFQSAPIVKPMVKPAPMEPIGMPIVPGTSMAAGIPRMNPEMRPLSASQSRPQPSAEQSAINSILNGGRPPADNGHRDDPSIKQLRTFKTDAEEAVRYQNVSKVSIAVAEHTKKETNTPIQYESDKRSILPIILMAFLLLLLGGAGGYYWFFMRTMSAPSISQTLSVNTLIPYTKIDGVSITAGTDPLVAIGQKLSQTDIHIGEVYAVIPFTPGSASSSAVSSLFANTHIPSRLDRSLAADYMIGTYLYNNNGPFIILKNTFFQNAYAGMLEWEKDMRNDLISLIHVTYPQEQPVTVNSDVFEDTVVSNIDVRVLRDDEGNPLLMYAFADKDTIVIATHLDTLKYVLDRLLSVRVVQ